MKMWGVLPVLPALDLDEHPAGRQIEVGKQTPRPRQGHLLKAGLGRKELFQQSSGPLMR
jgi:hypothetical protein